MDARPITSRATCSLCEAACGLLVTHDGVRVGSIQGDTGDPQSQGYLCVKAHARADVHADPDRLRRPLRRSGDRWLEIPWDEALDEAAERLTDVARRHGPEAVAVYVGNPAAHGYATILLGPVLLQALGTKSFYTANSVDGLPRLWVSWKLYGNQLHIPVPDVDRTALLLVVGANPAVSNGSGLTAPGIKERLRALRARGGHVIVIDPRRTETADLADEHLSVRPGADVPLRSDGGALRGTVLAAGAGGRTRGARGLADSVRSRAARPPSQGASRPADGARAAAAHARSAARAGPAPQGRPVRQAPLVAEGTLARLEARPEGVDLGPLVPRLATILGRRRLHLAPDAIARELRRVAAEELDTPATPRLIGRRQLRSNNSWMHNVERLARGRDRCTLLMHPDDARARAISAGQQVEVSSRVGRVRVPVEISERMMAGVVSLPHGFGHGRSGTRQAVAARRPGASMNDLTDDGRVDRISACAVLSSVPVEVRAVTSTEPMIEPAVPSSIPVTTPPLPGGAEG